MFVSIDFPAFFKEFKTSNLSTGETWNFPFNTQGKCLCGGLDVAIATQPTGFEDWRCCGNLAKMIAYLFRKGDISSEKNLVGWVI